MTPNVVRIPWRRLAQERRREDPDLSDRAWRVGLLSIVAIAAAIRLHALDRFSYGLDEILQTYWMNGSWHFFWSSIRFDAGHPPLDYLIARIWQEVHPSDVIRKLPVISYGIATVGVFGALIARRAGRTAGLIAASLLAVAPFHVRYSQELRPYSLELLLLCLSVLCLDRYLESPAPTRLVLLFAASLATIYTAYIPQILLGFVGLAVLIEDSLDSVPGRRAAARRALVFSPLFILALWLAYLPWWPVQLEAASRRLPIPAADPLSWSRVGRILAFFATSSDGSDPFRAGDALFLGLALIGTLFAICHRRLRFLPVWAFGGLGLVEILWRIHPHWDVARIFLPAGISLCALAALAIAELASRGSLSRLAGAFLLVGVLLINLHGTRVYFQNGHADWRPLARFLRERPPQEWVFTENAYTSLCLAFYVVGPDSAYHEHKIGRPVRSLDGEALRLTYSWPPGTTTWVVTGPGDNHPDLRDWLKQFPSTPYPSAEGCVLYRLDPAARQEAFEGVRAPRR